MKPILYSVCILIALAVLFVFIDRKDFYSDNNTNVREQTETQSSMMFLSQSDEELTHINVYGKNVEQSKTIPDDVKNIVVTKQTETKSENETQLLGKGHLLFPVAIPVVSPDEAQKKNEEALEYGFAEKEKKEPFLELYEEQVLETIAFEGTILASSTIPDPATNDYDNCLYALLIEIDSLLFPSPLSETIERTVLINIPIMKDKVIIRSNEFSPGDKVSCICAEYNAMPQVILEIQLSDDIQSFEHQQYYTLTINKISSFQKTGNKQFAKREITILPIQSFPEDEKTIALRHDRIQKEINRIENELEKHGGSFERWKEDYKSIAEKYDKLCKEKFKGWINDSYFAAEGEETTYSTKEYIDGILPYKEYLEKNNIDLIIVRIPSKWDFAARVLASDDFQENPAWVEHYYECMKNDIEIIDPMPEMWNERFDFPLFYFYNRPNELHPFEGSSFVSAKVLSSVLERYQYKKTEQEIILTDSIVFQSNNPLYFWPAGNKKYDPKTNVTFKQVFQNGKTIGNLSASSGSPFLFLSNSFFAHPQRSSGASVPGYAAYFIQAVPDWFYQDGTHNPMIRNLFARQDLLNFRKAVIMVGNPADWKEFPPIPKYIVDQATRITLEKSLNVLSDEITIHDNDSFSYTTDGNDIVTFVPNSKPSAKNQFDFVFSVPFIEGKKSCMIRVIFEKTFYITLNLEDRSETIIDTCTLAPGGRRSADLFVSLSNQDKDVRIRFLPKYYQREYAIKEIELWYY